MSSSRIHSGGGAVQCGLSDSSRRGVDTLATISSAVAPTTPTSGDSRSDLPTPTACAQSTPLVPLVGAINWFAIPTPMIADQRVRARRRQAQVPRAQIPDDGGDQQREHHRET